MKKINIAYWIVTGLLGLGVIASSIPDIMVTKEAIAIFDQLHYPHYLIAYLGWAKVIGMIVILIPGAVPVGLRIVFAPDVMRLFVSIGRQLHRPKRHRRPRICVAHLLSADQRIDVLDVPLGALPNYNCRKRKQDQQRHNFSHFF